MTVRPSNFARKKNDNYQTRERWVTEALLRHFPVHGLDVWECAAGEHLMADVLSDHGAHVFTSDIVDYGRPHSALFDFLSDREDYEVFHAIITNPPYGKGNRTAVKFVERALERCGGMVAMLLTMKFDSGSTRHHLFRDCPRFAAKIVLTDRIAWFGKGGGTEDHAWYIWRRSAIDGPRLFYEGKG